MVLRSKKETNLWESSPKNRSQGHTTEEPCQPPEGAACHAFKIAGSRGGELDFCASKTVRSCEAEGELEPAVVFGGDTEISRFD